MKLSAAIALASISSAAAFTGLPPTASISRVAALNGKNSADDSDVALTRRESLESLFLGVATIGFLASPEKANAFANKISNQYDDRPKQRGGKPKDLGVAMRKDMFGGEDYVGLKPCIGKPNCFCSTDNIEDSPASYIPAFKWPADKFSSQEDAFQQLYEVVQAYKPGQNNIDGGGFDIVKYDPKAGYIYVQFESFKNGYVDDLELAVVGDAKDNAVQVRSSSRLGYLDYGVNAKRINYLAKDLRDKGWEAPGVEFATHKGYAQENGVESF